MADTLFHLNRAGDVALVTIDNGEDYRKPTTLGRSAFESAVAVLDELERGDWTAAVFTGKPFVFCVGADIDEFTKLLEPIVGYVGRGMAAGPSTTSVGSGGSGGSASEGGSAAT